MGDFMKKHIFLLILNLSLNFITNLLCISETELTTSLNGFESVIKQLKIDIINLNKKKRF